MKYLLTGNEMAGADRRTWEIIGIPAIVLMERAALSVAQEVSSETDDGTAGKIEMLAKPIKKVLGGMKANEIELTDGSHIEIDGLFCMRNSIAPTTLLKGLELDGAHVIVNRAMETNLPGVFAAGDCTGRPYQIAKSVGEGNIAAHSIVEYLSDK